MSIKSIIQRMMQRRIDAVRHRKRSAKHDRFRRDAEQYLDEVLAPELGLSDARLLGRTWRTMKYTARLGDRKVFVKIMHKRQLRYLRRYLQAHDLLADAGIEIPEIIDSRTDAQTARGRRLGALVLGWIDAPPWDIENLDHRERAFANLARIHQIDPGTGSVFDKRSSGTRSALEPIDSVWLVHMAKNTLESIPMRIPPTDRSPRGWIIDYFESSMTELLGDAGGTEFLHMDYSPGNLLWGKAGEGSDSSCRIVTLDFEGARKGPFCFDLAHALLCLATDSHKIAGKDLDDLLRPARFEPWLAAYFDALPDETRDRTRDVWNRHARVVLLWTYLKLTGNRFKKSRDRYRFDKAERRRLASEGRTMWNKFEKVFVKMAARG